MKLRSPLLKLLAIGSISLYGHGCALGTEVGNGVKPDKGGDQSGGSKTARSSQGKLESYDDSLAGIFGDPETNSAGKVYEIDKGGVPAQLPSGGMGGLGTSVGDGISDVLTVSDKREVAPLARSETLKQSSLDPTIIDLALTGCQSPLYKQNPAGSASFAVVNSATSQKASIKIGTAAEPDTWSISSDDKSLVRFVKWSPQVVVTKPGPDGALVGVPSYGRCTPIAVSAPAVLAGYKETFTKTTYLVNTSRGNTYLTWYVMDGAGDYISRLKRIELDKAQSSPNPAVVISAP